MKRLGGLAILQSSGDSGVKGRPSRRGRQQTMANCKFRCSKVPCWPANLQWFPPIGCMLGHFNRFQGEEEELKPRPAVPRDVPQHVTICAADTSMIYHRGLLMLAAKIVLDDDIIDQHVASRSGPLKGYHQQNLPRQQVHFCIKMSNSVRK